MGNTVNTGGDPNIQAGLGNLLNFFDPKAAAEGAALQARTRNFDAETGFHTAKTGALNDRRKWLADDAALAAAGFTPRQILAFRMTGAENGVSDLFGGVRTDIGTQLVTQPGGDVRKGGVLLNVPAVLEADAALTQDDADRIRREKDAADLAKATAVANIAANGAAARTQTNTQSKERIAAEKAKNDAKLVDRDERYTFTPDQVNGPVRQAIVDLYSAGQKDVDFKTLDEGMIRKIIDTQQTLIATGLSTRSSSLADALAALGYVNSENADERMTVTKEDVPASRGTPASTRVAKVDIRKAPTLELGEIEGMIARREVSPEAYNGVPNYTEIPLRQLRDVLPMLRDQATLGDRFKIENRLYEKVQMPDGSTALVAI
jgi:hypothetical protein